MTLSLTQKKLRDLEDTAANIVALVEEVVDMFAADKARKKEEGEVGASEGGQLDIR